MFKLVSEDRRRKSTVLQIIRKSVSGNGKESFNPIPDPDADPDHHQNLITSKLGPSLTLL